MERSLKLDATRKNPVYLIQASEENGGRHPDLLLGEQLETTMFCTSKIKRREVGSIRLHVKNDSREGVRLGSNEIPGSDPHDIAGGIGGNNDLQEIVRAINLKFKTVVGSAGYSVIEFVSIAVEAPALLVRRSVLKEIFSELEEGEVIPYFGEVSLLSHSFEEIRDALQKATDEYRLIDGHSVTVPTVPLQSKEKPR